MNLSATSKLLPNTEADETARVFKKKIPFAGAFKSFFYEILVDVNKKK